MARRVVTTTQYTDDLDGSAAEGTVTFGFDGISYEIDLSRKNAREFEKALSVYVGHARKVRSRSGREMRQVAVGPDLAAVRAWAAAHGHKVAPRGRISKDVLASYAAAGN